MLCKILVFAAYLWTDVWRFSLSCLIGGGIGLLIGLLTRDIVSLKPLFERFSEIFMFMAKSHFLEIACLVDSIAIVVYLLYIGRKTKKDCFDK
jgi:hypothetical protein